ncbi:MAG: hypothetical protein JXA30_22295 [Deltaproteobacteria bacterium]|nr:hypothetical protein [Deltaproteobacteria bacterium]
MNCKNHPEREAVYFCQKTKQWFCPECGSRCLSPKAYCKFRLDCVIWIQEHERDRAPEKDSVNHTSE